MITTKWSHLYLQPMQKNIHSWTQTSDKKLSVPAILIPIIYSSIHIFRRKKKKKRENTHRIYQPILVEISQLKKPNKSWCQESNSRIVSCQAKMKLEKRLKWKLWREKKKKAIQTKEHKRKKSPMIYKKKKKEVLLMAKNSRQMRVSWKKYS